MTLRICSHGAGLYMGKEYKRISDMEQIFDEVLAAQESLEKAIEDYKNMQGKIRKLEKYYSGKQWKEDYAADERGEIPADVKRGVLSEDGIYNMLERNKEYLEILERGFE